MMIIEQGSQFWLDLRRTKVCASDMLAIMNISPWMNRQELLDEKVGLRERRPRNSAMNRGIILEPVARKCYEELTGNTMAPDVKIHPVNDWMLASLDGISIDEKIILEIKCTNKKNHELARNGKIPDYYMPQVQYQICVCNTDSCHYFSFDGSNGVLVVVERDDDLIEHMKIESKKFYDDMLKLRSDLDYL